MNESIRKYKDDTAMGFTYNQSTLDAVCLDKVKGSQGNNIENCWTITRILVAKDFRRQGVATKLVTAICEEADKEHFNLELDARPYSCPNNISEQELIDFFKKFGFVSQPNYAYNMVRLCN